MSLDRVRKRAEQDAKSRGYYLNPDPGFLNDLRMVPASAASTWMRLPT
jgi:ferredoxin-thioredoxin reductase catalytic subunit